MIKRLLLISVIMTLVGCTTTVPVTAKFPDAPKYGLERCPRLLKLNPDAKLSDVAQNVILNYSNYYECDVKNDAWIEWYQDQKRIFESVK